MNALSGIQAWLARYYDKLLAAIGLALLIGSVVWVGIRLGTLAGGQREFRQWLAAMTPLHPQASAVAVDAYAQSEGALKSPPQTAAWSNALMVPETRCWCIDCLRPITLETDVCPFCRFPQPTGKTPTDLDSDYDGIPDVWEKQYNMDPRDVSDDARDPDGDGFTNLEEYQADTDPTAASAHPPYATKLVLGPVKAEPFKLQFKSVLSLPDGGKKFAINTRDGGKTYFVKLGETVEEFEVFKFEEKFEERNTPAGLQRVNVSLLTLRRQNKLIPLTMGLLQSYVEYRVSLLLTLDGTEIPIKVNETIAVRDESYRVMAIDIRKENVVLERLPDNQRFDVRKPLQASDQTTRMP